VLETHKIIGTVGFLGGIMSLPTPFTWSWGNMLVFSHEALCQANEHIEPDYSRQSLHDYARNELVSRMKGDWLVMLDTDTAFEADFVARLIATMQRYNVDVLSGIYSFKTFPYSPVLWMRNLETDRHEVIGDWNRESDIFPIGAAGGGCLAVRRRVFDRIREELKEQPFERMGTKGEDFSFFRRLQKLGIQAWCAWKIEMVHLEYERIRTSNYYDPENQILKRLHEYQVEGRRFEVVGAHG
jgi:hypothetical protein